MENNKMINTKQTDGKTSKDNNSIPVTKQLLKSEDVIKQIGNYKASFKAAYNGENDNFIYLDISITPQLQEILKFCCSETNKNKVNLDNYDENLKRYKVKDWLYNSLYGEGRELLFIDSLIENRNAKIPFGSLRDLEGTLNYIRDNIRKIIIEVLRSRELNITIEFKIEKKEVTSYD